MHEKYGPIIRVGPKTIHLSDPHDLRLVYSLQANFEKGHRYDIQFDKHNKTLFSLIDRDEHRIRRRMFGHAYAPGSVLRLEQFVTQKIEKLVSNIKTKVKEGQVVDLASAYKQLTTDVMLRFAFGIDARIIEGDQIHPIITALMKMLRYNFPNWSNLLARQYIIPYKLQWTRPLWWSTLRGTHDTVQTFINHGNDLIRDLENDKDRPDSTPMARVVNAIDPESGRKMDIGTVASEARLVMVAGIDTTSATLKLGTFEMFRKQALLKRARDELATVPKDADYATLNKLPFLSAVIHETFRLHPAVPGPLPRRIPKEGLHVQGHFIPHGHEVIMSSHVVHRHPTLWGDDPEDFNPDRWLSEDTDHVNEMRKHLFHFNMGARSCIGKNLAMLELYLMFAAIFRNFDIEEVQSTAEELDVYGGFLVMSKVEALMVRLKVI